ncbi:hypothetical protein [Jiangella anatolica]|uniref:hypothetical protein n=1 Tax=Jiangella anatolica TaxID=2670374 RepID=UPI0013144AB8|nr:hypothetical protein [Jiangella anatolica]
MGKLVIEINTDNAAFEENPTEITDILKTIGNWIDGFGETEGIARDSNGNTVGFYKLEP